MHFRPQILKRSSTSASSSSVSSVATSSDTSTLSQQSTAVLEVVEESDSEMVTPGVSSWDFAYMTGKCNLPICTKNSCFTKDFPSAIVRERPVAHDNSKSKKHSRNSSQPNDSKTYLLSSPTPASIAHPHTYTTISTLLAQPNTKLLYIVPQCSIVCPKVCELMRLARASGSSLQILPVSPNIEMMFGGEDRSALVDGLGVQEVVDKVVKNTKVRHFDGYVAFEEDREAWTFLEKVGQGVKEAPKKV